MDNETDVRHWLRKLSLPITWIEAGRGGTGGAADAVLHLHDATIPIELKFWQRSKDYRYWLAKMRAPQIRYHYVMNASGIKTLLMWSDPQTQGVYAMGGQHAPRKTSERVLLHDTITPPYAQRYFFFPDSGRADFERALRADKFWPSIPFDSNNGAECHA